MEFSAEKARFQHWKHEWAKIAAGALGEDGSLKYEKNLQLTKALSDYSGDSYVRLCAKWTDGLAILLASLEVTSEDAIFLPAFGPAEILRPLRQFGAQVVFCDIHPRTFTLDINSVQKAIKQVMFDAKKRARVILALDSFGLPCDYPALQQISERYGLLLVDLAVDGLGGSCHLQRVPAFGDAGICSFALGSTVAAFADGAAIFCHKEDLFTKVSLWQGNGRDTASGDWLVPGFGSEIHPHESAVLLQKLASYNDSEGARRAGLAAFYSAQFQDILDPPFVPAGFSSGWQSYCVLLPQASQRDAFRRSLAEAGIATQIPSWYDLAAIHRSWTEPDAPARQDFSATAEIVERMLFLPLHPYLTLADARQICAAVREFWPE